MKDMKKFVEVSKQHFFDTLFEMNLYVHVHGKYPYDVHYTTPDGKDVYGIVKTLVDSDGNVVYPEIEKYFVNKKLLR